MNSRPTHRWMLDVGCWMLDVFLLFGALLFSTRSYAANPGVVDTSACPFAKVQSVGLDEVRWTRGFWAERFDLCRTQMVPSMGRLMEGTNYTQFLQNFRIAAGLAQGSKRGASFNDGDFYKWMEAASALLAVTNDPALKSQLDDIISVIAKAQRSDGYIDTSVLIRERRGDTNAQPFKDPQPFEMYNLGHLLTAACVHYRATGQTNFLEVARKAADFLEVTLRHPPPDLSRNSVCPSHYMGIVELYRTTRDARYLELAKEFLALRNKVKEGADDNQDRLPFEKQTEAVGHAARANYLYAGEADMYLETGDPKLWQPLERIWTNVVEKKLYITGGCGALYDGASPYGARNQRGIGRVHQAYGYNYELPNTTAHAETCANVGNVLWNWRMFLATGEARFMDVLELTLYNSVLSGVDLTGTNFFYVNPLRRLDPMPTELRWSRTRVPFVGSFCCPPNLVRTIAESADYAYAKSDDAIWVNLYGGSTLDTELPGGRKVELRQESDYPWNGRVRITIHECDGNEFALKLRIPGWARSAELHVNDAPLELSPTPGTYLSVRRAWHAGDVLELDLPMPAELVEANPQVEETLNQVAAKRGPLVYCLESTDLPDRTPLLDVLIPDNIELSARYDQHLLDGVVVLDGRALLRPAENWDRKLYRNFRPTSLKPVKLHLIPYFLWDNRGPSEMTVWLPLARSR